MPYSCPSVVEQNVFSLKVLSLDGRPLLTCTTMNVKEAWLGWYHIYDVLRDTWTKLNVHPAKIMQVRFITVSCMYLLVL